MNPLKLAGVVLASVGAGVFAYHLVTIALLIAAAGAGREMNWAMWEDARLGVTVGVVMAFGGVLLTRWK